MQELAFDNLATCEIQAIDTGVHAAAVVFELHRLTAEVGFRAEDIDREV